MAGGIRIRRIADLLRALLSELLMREVQDPRLHGVQLTEVRISPDLSLATVYYSLYAGGEGARAEAEVAFERARGFLRREVGRRAGLRVTPNLRFRYDTSGEHAAHIDDVLQHQLQPPPEDEEGKGDDDGDGEGSKGGRGGA